MKKKALSIVLILVLAALTLAGCGGGSSGGGEGESGEKTVKLNFNHAFTEQDARGKTYQFFADKCRELSNGSIDITVYPSEGLVKNQEALKAVMTKTVDMASTPTSLNSNEAKALAPMDVPGQYEPRQWRKTNEAIKGVMDEILAEYNQKYLFATDEGDTIVYLNKKNKKDIHKATDLKGLRIRDHGTWVGKTISAWGGSPMTVVPADVAVAFDRGTVDGGYTGWPFVMSFKLYESAPYVSNLGLSNSTWLYVSINNDSWNSLSDNQKKIMEEAADLAMDYNESIMDDYYKEFEAAVKKAGGTIYNCTEEEKAAFMKDTEGLLKEVREFSGELGAKLMDTMAEVEYE